MLRPSPGWPPNPSDLGPGFHKASGSSRRSRRRQQVTGSKHIGVASKQGSRTLLRAANTSHPLMAGNNGRQQSARVAHRRALAYQLGRGDLCRYRSAALVSACAVTSYESHSTGLSQVTKQIRALLAAARTSGGKDECQVRLRSETFYGKHPRAPEKNNSRSSDVFDQSGSASSRTCK